MNKGLERRQDRARRDFWRKVEVGAVPNAGAQVGSGPYTPAIAVGDPERPASAAPVVGVFVARVAQLLT